MSPREHGRAANLGSTCGYRTRRGRGTEEWKVFRNHISIDGSSKEVSGREAACGWAVVQLDEDEDEESLQAHKNAMLAELEAQGTIKRAEMWAFAMALSGLSGPSAFFLTFHTDQ